MSGEQFFEKNVPHGAPSWLPRVELARRGSRGSGESIIYPLLEELRDRLAAFRKSAS